MYSGNIVCTKYFVVLSQVSYDFPLWILLIIVSFVCDVVKYFNQVICFYIDNISVTIMVDFTLL